MSFLNNIPEVSRHHVGEGYLIHGIAEGETVVRLWNPWLAHGTAKAGYRHLNNSFCCLHKVTVVDPSTCQPTMKRVVWFRAPVRLDFARYATDYRQVIAGQPLRPEGRGFYPERHDELITKAKAKQEVSQL